MFKKKNKKNCEADGELHVLFVTVVRKWVHGNPKCIILLLMQWWEKKKQLWHVCFLFFFVFKAPIYQASIFALIFVHVNKQQTLLWNLDFAVCAAAVASLRDPSPSPPSNMSKSSTMADWVTASRWILSENIMEISHGRGHWWLKCANVRMNRFEGQHDYTSAATRLQFRRKRICQPRCQQLCSVNLM